MNHKYLRYIFVFITFLFLPCSLSLTVSAGSKRTKAINVVYDDSGSMAVNGGDSWSQAKYALEVFTAMMGYNDILTIYPMSSFSYVKNTDEKSSTWGQKIIVKGSDDASLRINQVSMMNGADGLYLNTPIDSVKVAGNDLLMSSADDKWLVILTDGIFDYGKDTPHVPVEEADRTILSYAGQGGISCAYISIGNSAHPMTAYSDVNGFFPYQAREGKILTTVTKVARNVYNLQNIPSYKDTRITFTPDIPMSKIIMFSQGDNIKSGDLSLNGEVFSTDPETVHVGISKDASLMPENPGYNSTVADGLNGIVQTYMADSESPFPPGEYSFETQALTTEIYFEPGVDILTYITDAATPEKVFIDGEHKITSGKKKIHVQIINPLTNELIDTESSSMLEGVNLSTLVTDPSGTVNEYSDGDEIVFEAGTYDIYSKASFRGDVEKTSTEVALDVKPKELSLQSLNHSVSVFGINSLKSTDGIRFSVKDPSGDYLNDAEYKSISFPDVSGPGGVDWSEIIPEQERGVYTIHPKYFEDTIGKKPHSAEIGKSGDISIRVEVSEGGIIRSGTIKIPVSFAVDVDAVAELVNQKGESVSLDSEWNEAVSGEYTVRVYFAQGNGVLPDDQVTVPWAFQKNLVIKDSNNVSLTYTDGDVIKLSEGKYSTKTVVSCIGTEDRLGMVKGLNVVKDSIKIIFDQEDSYVYSMTDLSSKKGIAFKVVNSDESDIPLEGLKSVVFTEVTGPEGVNWNNIKMDQAGIFYRHCVCEMGSRRGTNRT